jgi:H+/Cl- antiporter ClcA
MPPITFLLQRLLTRSGEKIEQHAVLFAILGIFIGLCSALLIVAFRLSIELSQAFLLPVPVEDYESLNPALKYMLPCIGFLFIAVVIHFFGGRSPRVGLAHVMERMSHHQEYGEPICYRSGCGN